MIRTCMLALVLVIAALPAFPDAVEPQYEGIYGNPETPALRPYKWLWHGVKSLFYHTGKSFAKGNMGTPVLGSVEGLRGLRKGTVELGESAFKGALFTPVPQKNYYKGLHNANETIGDEPFLKNLSDFAFSLPFFPLMKVLDEHPGISDDKVDILWSRAERTREARREAREARKPALPRVKAAQKRYLGDRAEFDNREQAEGRGNLLKLAK